VNIVATITSSLLVTIIMYYILEITPRQAKYCNYHREYKHMLICVIYGERRKRDASPNILPGPGTFI